MPRGAATLTLSRLAWLNPNAAQWELYELDQSSEELEQREAADNGNLTTRLLHAPNRQAAHDRFADASKRVLALVPESARDIVEQKIRNPSELAFLIHGLEFARIRTGYSGNSFNQAHEITFGAGANETPLTEDNAAELRELVARLFGRRTATGDKRDPLYRMQPERWLESVLRSNVEPLDPHLNSAHVYTQVPAFAASDRGMLDLLGVSTDGRLAVIELKADEDLHLALQGLDYWIRVRWHHLETADTATGPSFGLGEFQRHGYFPGLRLSPDPPRLYLVGSRTSYPPRHRNHPPLSLTPSRLDAPRPRRTLAQTGEVVWRKRSNQSQ